MNRPADYSNTAEIGRVLYTDYLLPFELASVVLLVAIIAAIVLTLRDRQDNKSMNPAEQVLVKKQDRLRIVKMDAVFETLPVEVSELEKDKSLSAKEKRLLKKAIFKNITAPVRSYKLLQFKSIHLLKLAAIISGIILGPLYLVNKNIKPYSVIQVQLFPKDAERS